MDELNLWPEDIFKGELRAPVTILKEQAQLLTRRSRLKIRGKIYTDWDSSYGSHEQVEHLFRLEVPGLGDYGFDLIRIQHNPHALYPCSVYYNLEEDMDLRGSQANSEDEFIRILSTIFHDDRTRQLLRTLLAQVTDRSIRPPEKREESTDDEDIPF